MTNHDDFQQTALPHMTALRDYALRLTMNSDNANDLVQETYLKAFRFWNRFTKGTNIKAWLCRIMKNSYINRYRQGQIEPAHVCYEEYHLPYNERQETLFAHNPSLNKSRDEAFGDEVLRSIESMNDMFGTVVVLADVDGLSYEEIAKITGCPMGTVRSRLHRARKLLQSRLLAYAKENRYVSMKSGLKWSE